MSTWPVFGLRLIHGVGRLSTIAVYKTLTISPQAKLILILLLVLLSVFIIGLALAVFALHFCLSMLPPSPGDKKRRVIIKSRWNPSDPSGASYMTMPAAAATTNLRHRVNSVSFSTFSSDGGSSPFSSHQQPPPPLFSYASANHPQPAYEQEIYMDRPQRPPNKAKLANLATAFGVLFGGLLGFLFNALISIASILMLLAPVLLPLFAITVATSLVATNSKTVVGAVASVHRTFISPIKDYIVFPVGALASSVYTVVFGGWVTWNRIIKFIMFGPVRLMFQCLWSSIPTISQMTGRAMAFLVYSLAYFIANNPLKSDFPIDDFLMNLFSIVSVVWVSGINCACQVLNYVPVAGFLKNFNDPMLSLAVTFTINAALALPRELILRPIMLLEVPSVNQTHQFFMQALQTLGYYAQNSTTCQLDIYIYNGNGTLIGMVKGTIPVPPGDDIGYLVRFLQSDWAVCVLFSVMIDLGFLFWFQLLYIVLSVGWIVDPQGYFRIWNFDWTRDALLTTIEAGASVLDMFPTCTHTFNGTTEVNKWSGLGAGLSSAVWIGQVLVDVAAGEVYSALIFRPPEPFGHFAGYYLLGNAHLDELQWEVTVFASSLGCLIAYIDPAIGQSIEGLSESIVFRLPVVLAEIITFTRIIISDGNVEILDAISVTDLEIALQKTASLGDFWYQFQKGASAQTCTGQVTFFCSMGISTQSFLSAIFRLLILAVTMIIWLLKVVLGFFNSVSIGTIRAPNFDLFLQDAYRFACRFGMSFATIIPMDVPCQSSSKSNFCPIREMPGLQAPTTISTCAGTTACKFFQLPIVFLEIPIAILRMLTNLSDFKSILMTSIRGLIDVFLYRVLACLCPTGHLLDCIVDAVLKDGGTAVSDLFCLISRGIAFIITNFTELLLGWIDLILTLITGLLDGVNGDVGGWILKLLEKFFTLLGGSFGNFLTSIVLFALSLLMSIIVSICWGINFILFGSIEDECQEFEDQVNGVFGGSGVGDFNSPIYDVYKRRGTIPGKQQRQCTLRSTQLFANLILNRARRDIPGAFSATLDTGDVEVWNAFQCPLNSSSGSSNYVPQDNVSQKKKNATAHFTGLLEKEFGGRLPDDLDQVSLHLARKVQWEATSECGQFFRLVDKAGLVTSKMVITEKLKMTECVRLKAMGVVLSGFTAFSFLPKDIFYNTFSRLLVLGVQFGRIGLALVNWASDHAVPTKTLLSIAYQQQWANLHLDVSHYSQLKEAAGVDVEGRFIGTEARITMALEVMTPMTYMQRNFPSLFDPKRPSTDSIMDPLSGLVNFTLNFGNNIMDKMYEQASHVRNGSYANTTNYVGGLDYANQTAMREEFGPEMTKLMNLRWKSIGVTGVISSVIMGIVALVRGTGPIGDQSPTGQLEDMAIVATTSTPEAFKRIVEAPFAIYDNWPQLKQMIAESAQQRALAFYEAPAFANDQHPGVGHSIVAALGDVYIRSTASLPERAVSPWCAIKASRIWNVSLKEARDRLNGTACENVTLWDIATADGRSLNERFWHAVRPRNEEARQGREQIWSIGSKMADTTWRTIYLVAGGDKAEATFSERVARWKADGSDMFQRPADYYNGSRIARLRQSRDFINLHRHRQKEFQAWSNKNKNFLSSTHAYLLKQLTGHMKDVERSMHRAHAISYRLRKEVEVRKEMRASGLVGFNDTHVQHVTNQRLVAENFFDPIFNNTFMLNYTCSDLTASFCRECYFLASMIDLVIDRLEWFIVYYTDFCIVNLVFLSDSMVYFMNDLAPARTGRDGTSPPWFPVLGEPMGIMFQWTDAEIAAGGPSLTKWLENVINGPVPDWLTYGPCQARLDLYIADRTYARQQGMTFQVDPSLEIEDFIQNTVGFPYCKVEDTALYLFTDRYQEIALYGYQHLAQCGYLSEIDCSSQHYSLTGALWPTFVWAIAPQLVVYMFFPTLAQVFFIPGMLGAFVYHQIITYNWSLWCAWVLPQCNLIQTYQFASLTLLAKCNPWLGGFVTNATYSASNCYNPQLSWDYIECTDQFFSLFDILAYFRLWLGGDLGIAAFLGPIYASVFGSADPQNTFANWNTDPVKHRNFGSCSLLLALPYGGSALMLVLVASAVVLGVFMNVLSLLLMLFMFLGYLTTYLDEALEDIYNMLDERDEEEEEESREEETKKTEEEQT